jgi:hypothetical protein
MGYYKAVVDAKTDNEEAGLFQGRLAKAVTRFYLIV